ncbi:DUF3817 domain-containing protein [Paradesertivirga mongoliensis]|uniref:DUF3817 domain-containing protein n=1 Tax=Paradesertivirga mongoliensis TaxID=2100740 RepID=A0ABW4ZME8_9SPHI|nr:DUF3817 domain-containing protein [Pedobacter mongoliensis]
MESNKAKIIRDLRWIGIAEGVSFLVLLLIAMPMKYIYGNAMPVKVVGWAHGALFVIYVLAVLRATLALSWNYKRTGLFLAASFLPLGPFFFDGNLSREQEQY